MVSCLVSSSQLWKNLLSLYVVEFHFGLCWGGSLLSKSPCERGNRRMESRQWEKLWPMISYRKVMARASWSSTVFLRKVMFFLYPFISWHANAAPKSQHSSESCSNQILGFAHQGGQYRHPGGRNVLPHGATLEHYLLGWHCDFSDSTSDNSRIIQQFNATTTAHVLWFVSRPRLQLVSHWNPAPAQR